MNTFQFSSAQLCPTLCDPMDCSTPGLPVHHQLPELTKTHFHGVGDAIQPSHPLSSFFSCPQSFPASGSFTSDGQSIGALASTSVLPMNTQHWSPLWWTGWISLQSEGPSRVFSNITVHKHPFERENGMAEEQVDVEDISLRGYIRNTPSDTELQAAAAESRQESLTREKK